MVRRSRWFLWSLLAFIGTVVILLAAAVWLAGKESTLQWTIKRVTDALSGTLIIEGAQGTFYGPIDIESLQFENAEKRITVKQIHLDWSPRELSNLLVHIHQLTASSLEIYTKQASKEPAKLPNNLKLPIAIRADDVRLNRLIISGTDMKESVALKDMKATLKSDRHNHKVNLSHIDSQWANGNIVFEIGSRKPFSINAVSHFNGYAPRAFALNLNLGGTLEAIAISANGAMNNSKVTLTTVATPFDKIPLQSFLFDISEVNLHDWNAALPITKIIAKGNGKIDEKAAVDANVSLSNSLPGSIDSQHLPIKTLTGQLAGKIDQFHIKNLAIDLGVAGQVNGQGQRINDKAQVTLQTNNLNLQAIHGKLRATQIAGSISLNATGKNLEKQQLLAKLEEKTLKMQLNLDASHINQEIKITSAQLKSDGGDVNAQGKLGLDGKQAFEFSGAIAHLNPKAFGNFPFADINSTMKAKGQIADPLMANLVFEITNSQLRGQSLFGKGSLDLTKERLSNVDIKLDLAGNQAYAQGAFGNVKDVLLWQIDAPNLARLDSSISGMVKGKGKFSGAIKDPNINFELVANTLNLPSLISIANLNADGNLGTGKNGALNLHVKAKNLKQGNVELADVTGSLEGTKPQHTLQASVRGKPDIDSEIKMTGGLLDNNAWKGKIEKLLNRGRYAIQLKTVASMEVNKGSFNLENASLSLADGSLNLEKLSWADGKIVTRGSASQLSIAYIQRLFPEQTRAEDVKANLTLKGNWSIDASENTINGKLVLEREGGDLVLQTDPIMPIGITQLRLTADIVQGQLKAAFNLQGKTVGVFNANLNTVLSHSNNVWSIQTDSPFVVEANGNMPSLAWARLFLNPGYGIDGRMRLEYRQTGSIKSPQVSGNVEGSNLALRITDYGINLHDGVLKANFAENKMIISQFLMRGDEGDITADGSLTLGQGSSDFEAGANIQANKLKILNHPDYQLTVSGTGKVMFASGKIGITGDLKADKGSVRLPNTNRPSLSDDVVVVSKTTTAKEKSAGARLLSIDMKLDMGNDFSLKGKGIDASLRGNLQVRSAPPGLPVGFGVIRVANGTYEAYGQKLSIERGRLTFSGPIDNPSLDILAVRKNLSVEPGVAITGTALSPHVKLVSEPTVPDTEKLAWLVLGHGLEGSSGAEMDLLPVAAAALLSANGSDPTGGIAKTFGVDEIGVGRGTSTANNNSANGSSLAEQKVLTIGKRISSNLYLTYEAGLNVTSKVVRLRYELSRRWSVRAETGTRSAVDLFYTLRFE